MILDPLSGQVLALAGDTTLAGGEAMLSRHPAGTIQTPLLALTGFARGLSPASLVWDIPAESVASLDPASVFHGPTRLRTALTNDYRAALSTIFQQVGTAGVTTTAHSLGLTDFALPADAGKQLDPGPILSPLDLAQAFSVFSTLGSLSGVQKPGSAYLLPQLVLSVEDANGDAIIGEIQAQTRPVVSPQLAYLVQDVFTERPTGSGNGQRTNPYLLDRPAGAKTGSANGGRSSWTVGYTRQLVTAVWLGYSQVEETSQALPAEAAAGIWQALMAYASEGQPALGWEMPAGVSMLEVCDPSGLLPSADCPNVVTELFLDGNLPVTADNLYQRFQINRETGRLATIFTPSGTGGRQHLPGGAAGSSGMEPAGQFAASAN